MPSISKYKKACLLVVLLFSLTQLLYSAPAPLRILQTRQVDGSTFQYRVFGDESFHWYETLDNYTIYPNQTDGYWYYVSGYDNIQPKLTNLRVTQNKGKINLQKWIQPEPSVLSALRKSLFRSSETKTSESEGSGWDIYHSVKRPIVGNIKLPVFLVDFAPGNQSAHVFNVSDFDKLFNSLSVMSPGSLREYYRETSSGKLDLTFDIYNWVTMPNPYSYYCGSSGMGSYPNNTQSLCIDVVRAVDNYVDFSAYDSDNNGIVDGIVLVYEGYTYSSPNLIWPHMFCLFTDDPRTTLYADGVNISGYFVVPEQQTTNQISTIGVYCHELGHMIAGAPDLYDYDSGNLMTWDDNNYPVYMWCLMGVGCYGTSPSGREGDCPAHLSAFQRWLIFGWQYPKVLIESASISIKAAESSDNDLYYLIPINGSGDEFFLLENRYTGDASTKFDKYDEYANPLDRGLIISHVDRRMKEEMYLGGGNNNGPSMQYYQVWVEDPGQPQSLTSSPYLTKKNAAYSSEDNQTDFSAVTTPANSKSNSGASTNIRVSNISASGKTMNFYASVPTLQLAKLDNADFEVFSDSWSISGSSGAIISAVSEVIPKSGNRMFGLQTNGTASAFSSATQRLLVQPGENCKFSIWVNIVSSGGANQSVGARILLDPIGEQKFVPKFEQVIIGTTNGWQKISVSCTAEAAFLGVRIELFQTGYTTRSVICADLAELSSGTVCIKGDPSCDTEITPGDALLAFNLYLETYNPTGDEDCDVRCSADIDSNGSVTPGDALCIFFTYLERPC